MLLLECNTMNDHSSNEVGLFGYFGANNLGDDLMMSSAVRVLADGGLHTTIFARDPLLVPPTHTAVTKVYGAHPMSAIRRLTSLDHVIRCGGTIFHDETGHRASHMLISYGKQLALLLVCRLLRVRISMVGVGIGIVHRRSTHLLLKYALRLCDSVVVRDPISLQRVAALAPTTDSALGVDLAFLDRRLHQTGPQGRNLVASLVDLQRYGHSFDEINTQADFWASLILETVEQEQASDVRLLVFKDSDTESDLAVSTIVAEKLKTLGQSSTVCMHLTVGAAIDEVRQAGIVLATRYHAALLASGLGRPLIVVPYNDKLRCLALDLGLDGSLIELDTTHHIKKGSPTKPSTANLSNLEERIEITKAALLGAGAQA